MSLAPSRSPNSPWREVVDHVPRTTTNMGTTLDWFRNGGPTMPLIAAIGFAGLIVLLERIYVIVFRSKNNGRVFIERIIQLVRGGKIDEAIKLCAGSKAALPDMGLVILRSRSRDESDLQNLADAATLAVVPRLTRRSQYLPVLAISATLLGILGTVCGVRSALLTAAATHAQNAVDAGIAYALNPLAFGLGVAVVLTLGRGYIVSQSESITEQIHEFSARLINALIDRPDVRLGHR